VGRQVAQHAGLATGKGLVGACPVAGRWLRAARAGEQIHNLRNQTRISGPVHFAARLCTRLKQPFSPSKPAPCFLETSLAYHRTAQHRVGAGEGRCLVRMVQFRPLDRLAAPPRSVLSALLFGIFAIVYGQARVPTDL
jgi:hypothetical protein